VAIHGGNTIREECEKIEVLARMIEEIAEELVYAVNTTPPTTVSYPYIREASRISRQATSIVYGLLRDFCRGRL